MNEKAINTFLGLSTIQMIVVLSTVIIVFSIFVLVRIRIWELLKHKFQLKENCPQLKSVALPFNPIEEYFPDVRAVGYPNRFMFYIKAFETVRFSRSQAKIFNEEYKKAYAMTKNSGKAFKLLYFDISEIVL